jgi:trimeric autotransporter adhesin
VPIFRWNAKGTDPAITHVGPTAQDFYAAFGLGDSDRRISTIDAEGIALAAIKALHEQNLALQAQLVMQARAFETRLQPLERAAELREAGATAAAMKAGSCAVASSEHQHDQ